ncbi:sigma-54 dependent transcriptional regulator [Jiella sp. MQZ9-1]|uniref:Sigma-54-dependent Fis family transcriptional regulator n=1 Tax=Jiella flava TaxID=2816857 RepID=A0A939G199_9HYPH|nr:sigma-54 dependent transcriptional regulator [Jiella flava]MBO0664516.1 sigma-54-dependent Fis family transcriptional regulator [Jiella flava]MCD2473153.1 sigma-54 dependent transcriptional regulator [Jiella flava]
MPGFGEPTVHLLDDDDDLRDALRQGLELEGMPVELHETGASLLARIAHDSYAVIVSDIRMPGGDGLALMKAALAVDPTMPVILITGHGDVQMAVDAMRAGAYDFIEKPFSVSRLYAVVERALEKRRLVLENRILRSTLDDGDELTLRLVGRTPGIQRLRQQIHALADPDVDVLVLGETGTGKEVVARALHDCGSRAKGNFVAINCAALPADIIESELFGHEPGAFTGASKQRIGKLEHADGGTIFLDEIESMPLDLQAKLLRAIETRSVERLGSNRAIPLDLRFVAATKTDLAAAGREGRFRSDLYYRLNVVTLTIPPLRERREDVPLLFFHLAREARARFRREIPAIDHALEMQLVRRDWPGNVRELRNYADRFVLGMWAGFDEPGGGAVPSSVSPPAASSARPSESAGSLADRLAAYERSVIEAELARHGGSLKPTYEALQISRKGLYDKIRRLGIESPERLEE